MILLAAASTVAARADTYPVSGRWGVGQPSKQPVDCAKLRVIAFNGAGSSSVRTPTLSSRSRFTPDIRNLHAQAFLAGPAGRESNPNATARNNRSRRLDRNRGSQRYLGDWT